MTKSKENKLIAVSRSEKQLKELQAKFGKQQVEIVIGNVSDKHTQVAAIERAVKGFGQLDSVIANAGKLDPVAKLSEANTDEWKTLFDVNFFSVVDLVKLALPHLRKSHGKLVAVLTGASEKPYKTWGAYGASKAALNHYVLTLAVEEPDVLAISVAPGVVDTSMQSDIRERFNDNMAPDLLQRFIGLHANQELLPPQVPATVYVNLALKGWDASINGKYLRYSDKELEEYHHF